MKTKSTTRIPDLSHRFDDPPLDGTIVLGIKDDGKVTLALWKDGEWWSDDRMYGDGKCWDLVLWTPLPTMPPWKKFESARKAWEENGK